MWRVKKYRFGLWASGFWFRVSGFWFRGSGFGCGVEGLPGDQGAQGPRETPALPPIPDFTFRGSSFEFRVQGFGVA